MHEQGIICLKCQSKAKKYETCAYVKYTNKLQDNDCELKSNIYVNSKGLYFHSLFEVYVYVLGGLTLYFQIIQLDESWR